MANQDFPGFRGVLLGMDKLAGKAFLDRNMEGTEIVHYRQQSIPVSREEYLRLKKYRTGFVIILTDTHYYYL